MTTNQSASLAVHGEIKRGHRVMEPKAPLTGGGEAPTVRSECFNCPVAHTPVRIDLAGWSRAATEGDPQDFFALFERADALGFDGVWFHEFRLLGDAGPYPSPLLLAAAVLARTERLRVGTSALVLPIHDPQLLAEELVQLHFQSGGRLDAGVGRGTDAATLRALDMDPGQTRARFESGCECLQRHAAHVPLYVAGSTAETLGFALARDLPLLLSLEPPEGGQLAHAQQSLQDHPEWAQGTALARSSLARFVCIAPTHQACTAILTPLWDALQERRVFFAARRGVARADVPRIDRARMLQDQFIVGTPEDVIAQISALFARTGMQHLRCVFNANGCLGKAQALAGMELFAREVLPVVRGQGI